MGLSRSKFSRGKGGKSGHDGGEVKGEGQDGVTVEVTEQDPEKSGQEDIGTQPGAYKLMFSGNVFALRILSF